jgi:hypothetical protein
MSLEQALTESFGTLDTAPDRDGAARELALIFARQIDKAAAIRAQADKALKLAEQNGDDALTEMVRSLKAKVSEQGTIATIGARLQASIDSLLMSPKARAAVTKGAPADDQPPANPLDELRERRVRATGP